MLRCSTCRGMSLGLCALAFAGACSKTADKGSPGPAATTTTTTPALASNAAPAAAVAQAATATTGCRGTMSGAASGPMTCEAWALFFLPSYKDATLRGNTEVTLMSSVKFNQKVPPPGVELVTWAAMLRGPLKPGTYTEKNLMPSGLSVAALDLTGKKRIEGLKRMKLVVKSLSDQGVHEDTVTKRGPTQSYKMDGNIELVIGGPSGEVTIQATLD